MLPSTMPRLSLALGDMQLNHCQPHGRYQAPVAQETPGKSSQSVPVLTLALTLCASEAGHVNEIPNQTLR